MKAADALLKAKVLTQHQYDTVKHVVVSTGERSEDVLLEHSVLTEAELLKAMAGLYKTKFASSDTLAKADIPLATLDMIPQKVAETFQVFPVLFDNKDHTLSIITSDPDDQSLMKELQLVSGAKDVRAFFARPAAVRACISRHYGKDPRAFEFFERAKALSQMVRTESLAPSTGAVRAASIAVGRDDTRLARPQAEGAGKGGFLEMPPMPASPRFSAPAAALPKTLTLDTPGESIKPQKIADAARAAAVQDPFGDTMVEMVNVLVSLLENGRADLRGHSAHVARLVRRLCERLKLGAREQRELVLAAYIHDLAKMGQFHLTALNVAEYDGHRLAAEKVVDTPTRLLEAVKLPKGTTEAVRQMYERWNGGGFPAGLANKEISLGARVLALCDVYADLTLNARNPFRKQLTPTEACAVLVSHRERIFDPHLVDLFRNLVLGEDVKNRLLSDRKRALIIDADPEESTVLELRMFEQGFDVQTVRTIEAAKAILEKEEIVIVIAESTFEDGSGLGLLAEARTARWGKDLAWVFHTSVQNRSDAQRAFELGALDFVAKPASTDVFVAKLKALTSGTKQGTSTRGVSGSLREMSLPDIVQILSQGRKTGKLVIRSQGKTGEIHFADGVIVQAIVGSTREAPAFYKLMTWKDGDFSLDPSFQPRERHITDSTESLLLEAMRHQDENII
ncbi:MAG: DUF4388 domain-containing protein [Polyangiaceae bacterium]